jgi:small-conductance mechanosensitive channel
MVGGNLVRDYAWAFAFFVALVVVFRLLQQVVFYRIHHLAEKTGTDIDDTLVGFVEKIRPPVYIVFALWVAVRSLVLSSLVRSIVDGAVVAVLVYQAIVTLQLLVSYVVGRRLRRGQSAKNSKTLAGPSNAESALGIVNKITAVVLWSLGVLFILSNFGIDVTSLVAGLGVGGIAIALAAQNILGDLFSSLAIYLDKPFAVGDVIVVGEETGTVTYIGIKTTRLRALSGEEVILANRDLTGARIKNLRRMTERRVVFEVAAAPTTPAEALPHIPKLVQSSIEATKQARFGRVHLIKVDGSGFRYEVVYHVTSPEYHVYREVQQTLTLNILQAATQASLELTAIG